MGILTQNRTNHEVWIQDGILIQFPLDLGVLGLKEEGPSAKLSPGSNVDLDLTSGSNVWFRPIPKLPEP